MQVLKNVTLSQGLVFSPLPSFLWFFFKVIVPHSGCIQPRWVAGWILLQESGLNGSVSRGWLPYRCVGGWLGAKQQWPSEFLCNLKFGVHLYMHPPQITSHFSTTEKCQIPIYCVCCCWNHKSKVLFRSVKVCSLRYVGMCMFSMSQERQMTGIPGR